MAELLAPAGSMERLRYALRYGADAVYCGGKKLGLRAFADNFDSEELAVACREAHSLGKRLYVTVNAFIKNSDLEGLDDYFREICHAGADAVIVSDPAALLRAKKAAPELELHISTQANVMNYETCRFYYELGAKRVILARELSLDEIKQIRDHVPDQLELEAFVHGAMCVSYSGRCLLSNFLDGREGNRGECVQPCRWRYEIREAGKDGLYYPVEQDESGTYILNSNDLMLIEHLGELIDAGITSLKIEGRMKTAFYVASVVNAYRMALDSLSAGRPFDTRLLDELSKLRHRPYTTGFMFGRQPAECVSGSTYAQTHDFVAAVISYDEISHTVTVQQRNRFFEGDELEVLSPGDFSKRVAVKNLRDESGILQPSAPHPCQTLVFDCPSPLKPMDVLRRRIDSSFTE